MGERVRVFHNEESNIYAEVIADSVAPTGVRLTTMQVQCHRFVLAEFNTHRKFSRNSASSRAIPVHKQLKRVTENPAIPLRFPMEQRGMQGGERLSKVAELDAKEIWIEAMESAVNAAERLVEIGVHKSVVNRLLEPFMWHTIIVSSTEWENYFRQRVSPLAQPEIEAVAGCMREVLNDSEPDVLDIGEWHRPYVRLEDETQVGYGLAGASENANLVLNGISAARCARVSYLTHEGIRSMEADLDLYEKLVTAEPPHWSPLEHVAMPSPWANHPAENNFTGWAQLRGFVEMERAAA